MGLGHQQQQQQYQRRGFRFHYNRYHILAAVLVVLCFGTVLLSFVHISHLEQHQNNNGGILQRFVDVQQRNNLKQPISSPKQRPQQQRHHFHPVAGLACSEHGGPTMAQDAQEIVYWRDVPQDSDWTSPFLTSETTETTSLLPRKYLTFVPDGGGWNNIRMSMETVLTMALAMGRVLVLPPSQKMYLLGQTSFNFADFFPLQELAEEHAGLEILTTQQFLVETMGKVRDVKTQQIVYPPQNNNTLWDGDTTGVKLHLNPWLSSIAYNPDWDPRYCIAAFPQSSDRNDIQALQQAMDDILAEGGDPAQHAYEEYINHPTPLDAPAKDRLREFLAGRRNLCIYDETLQAAPIVHFHGKAKQETGGRLLVHFYAFLFFQDWHHDLWMKRFVRDHVRYIDDIQCAAARIVHAIRATKLQPSDENQYDSFHVRRGDFQYKKTRVSAEELIAAAKEEIPIGRTVYIGTDERNKNFFQPLKDHGWKLLFLDDFQDVLGDINPNYFGMIDQLVASRGHIFFGCWFSTFTGYITRLRGYHSQTNIGAGGMPENSPDAKAFQKGQMPHSYYYAPMEHKTKLHDYWPIKQAFYAREFPSSWLQLDFDAP